MKQKNIILIWVISIILTIILTGSITWVVKTYLITGTAGTSTDNTANVPGQQQMQSGGNTSSSSVTYNSSSTGITLTSGIKSYSDQSYSATGADESAVIVKNGASLTLTNAIITKSGDSSSNDSSSFYGLNAGAIATGGSSLTIDGGTVNAIGAGSNGVFSTGSGTKVSLSNLTIYAAGGGAHAVMATQGGIMTLNNVDMTTTDSNSGALATDRGG